MAYTLEGSQVYRFELRAFSREIFSYWKEGEIPGWHLPYGAIPAKSYPCNICSWNSLKSCPVGRDVQ